LSPYPFPLLFVLALLVLFQSEVPGSDTVLLSDIPQVLTVVQGSIHMSVDVNHFGVNPSIGKHPANIKFL
jgi:hypothetical protein